MDILPIAYMPIINNYNNKVRIINKETKIKIKGLRYIKK
jgi:hypothetical protein